MSEGMAEELAPPLAAPRATKPARKFALWPSRLVFVVGVLALWGISARLVDSPLYPGPGEVWHAALAASVNGSLPRAIFISVLRLLFGYALSLVVGVPVGALLARSRWTKALLGPVVLGLSSVPSICWLPMAILWFGLSETSIQVVVVLGSLLPVAVATDNAVRHVPPQIERAARTMGARGVRLLFGVTLPAAFPGILAGAKLGWTFALRSLMAGELLFVSGGLGQLLETGRDLGDTALVLAIVVVVVILGRASEVLLFARLDRLIMRRWGTEGT